MTAAINVERTDCPFGTHDARTAPQIFHKTTTAYQGWGLLVEEHKKVGKHTKVFIRSSKSKKITQFNGKKKKDKRTNKD